MKNKITMSDLSLPLKIAVVTAILYLIAWVFDIVIWFFQPVF
ncbi:hypothetical protein LCGC14_0538310 [marine sediment metagenome]|uniref:Uncharacterized protein n=1 Tax=marine sediment metagenome TaxID=412755 RepID=A0A0F9V1V7_9ZZZZ